MICASKKEQFMKLSARNQIKGTVTNVKEGAVNGIVILDIGGGNQIVSSVTMDSIKNLGLKPGVEAYAVIKASSVMLAVE
jgi:molybdopterin-binding protein